METHTLYRFGTIRELAATFLDRTTMTIMKTLTNRFVPRRFWTSLALALSAAFLITEVNAATPLKVAIMPSYTQSTSYANVELGQPITIWGRAWGGTAPYDYEINFGDGTPNHTDTGVPEDGTIAGNRELSADHTYLTGGSKTVTLTVTDANNATATKTAVVRVLVSPSHKDRVNIAIERGKLYNYRNAQGADNPGNLDMAQRIYWQANGGDRGTGATGSVVLAFEETGHSEDNSDEQDIYAEVVRKGLVQLLNASTGYVTPLTPHTDGIAVRDSDGENPPFSAKNDKGAYFYGGHHGTYASAWAALALILSKNSAAAAEAAIVGSGPFAGESYYQVIQDVVDMYSYSQGDNGNRGGWEYEIHLTDGGRYDGSAQQWPQLVFRAAIDLWGLQPQQWVIDNSDFGYQALQNANGGIGYSNNSGWLNIAKTGGALVGWDVANKAVGDPNVDNAIEFIGNNWANTRDPGWAGGHYAMYGLKKGFQLQNLTTLTTNVGQRDWYEDLSAWLLGDASLLDPGIAPNHRVLSWSFGQKPDGSWDTVGWINDGPFATAHAILILVESVTVPLPVTTIIPVARKPLSYPFRMDGRRSFHQDPGLDIVLYEWDFDYDGTNFDVDAVGPLPINPGYSQARTYQVALRTTDNNANGGNTSLRVINVDAGGGNAPPVAESIPLGVPAYAGRVGQAIQLDGSQSFDPEGDPIITYDWDTDGDGVFGDAFGVTQTITFANPHTGVVGLQVTSEDGTGLQQSSSNQTFIDVYSSLNNLTVDLVNFTPTTPGQDGTAMVTVSNAADSQQNFNGLELRLFQSDPFLGGVPVSDKVSVDLNIGETKVVGPINVTGLNGATQIFGFIDSNSTIGEYNEVDNAMASNSPPTANCNNIVAKASSNGTAFVAASRIGAGSTDPDGDAITLAVNPPGPYNVGSTPVVLTVTDSKGAQSTCNAVVTVIESNTAPTISKIADQTTFGSTVIGPLPFTIADAQSAAAALTVGATSADQSVISDADILILGAGAARSVFVTNIRQASVPATLTVTVTDEGGLSATRSFSVTNFSGNSVIVDNKDAGFSSTGTWRESASIDEYKASSLFSSGGTTKATFNPGGLQPGNYEVFAWWSAFLPSGNTASRTPNAKYEIIRGTASGTTSTTVTKNQNVKSGEWVSLGKYDFNGDTAEQVCLTAGASNSLEFLSADAVAFVLIEAAPVQSNVIVDNKDAGFSSTGSWFESGTGAEYLFSSLHTWSPDATATWTPTLAEAGVYDVYVWIARQNANSGALFKRAPNVTYDVTHKGGTTTVNLNQGAQPSGAWALLGSFEFNAQGGEGLKLTTTSAGFSSGGGFADAAWFSLKGTNNGDFVFDNEDSSFSTTGIWSPSSATNAYDGGSVQSMSLGSTASWKFDGIPGGTYQVLIWISNKTVAGPISRNASATYVLSHAGGSDQITLNQNENGGQWHSLGSRTFTGSGVTFEGATLTAGGISTAADAFRLVKID